MRVLGHAGPASSSVTNVRVPVTPVITQSTASAASRGATWVFTVVSAMWST